MENQTQNQPQLTLDVAFNNIAALYEQARLTPKEHKVMEASLQMILEVAHPFPGIKMVINIVINTIYIFISIILYYTTIITN